MSLSIRDLAILPDTTLYHAWRDGLGMWAGYLWLHPKGTVYLMAPENAPELGASVWVEPTFSLVEAAAIIDKLTHKTSLFMTPEGLFLLPKQP